jgi:hypothetical protein
MGNAIKTGLGACNGDLIITMDADLTFRPVDVERLIEKYRDTQRSLKIWTGGTKTPFHPAEAGQ